MKVKVIKEKCLGCGMCVGINSDVFDFDDDGLAKTNSENIKDVVAFPKTTSASDLMSECPGKVSDVQLKELGLHVKVD